MLCSVLFVSVFPHTINTSVTYDLLFELADPFLCISTYEMRHET